MWGQGEPIPILGRLSPGPELNQRHLPEDVCASPT